MTETVPAWPADAREEGEGGVESEDGAEEGTRTPTPLRVHGPEPCASANSATSASGLQCAVAQKGCLSGRTTLHFTDASTPVKQDSPTTNLPRMHLRQSDPAPTSAKYHHQTSPRSLAKARTIIAKLQASRSHQRQVYGQPTKTPS